MRLLGIVRLTPEQQKLLDEIDKDYEKMLAQKNAAKKSTSPPDQSTNENH